MNQPISQSTADSEFKLPLYYPIILGIISFILSIALFVPLSWLLPNVSPGQQELMGGIVFQLTLLAAIFWTYKRYYPDRVLKAMGWVKPKHGLMLMGIGVIAVITQELAFTLMEVPEQDLNWTRKLGEQPALLLMLALVILAPLTEELFFRQMLWQSLQDKWHRPLLTTLLTGLGWTAMHTQYTAFVLTVLFLNSLLLGYLRHKGDSVLPCIGLHMLMNGLTCLMLIFEMGIYS